LRRKVIAIDFDGTIATEAYPSIGPEISGAIESIKRIQSLGAETILWTCRSGQQLEEAVSWLEERGVVFKYKNENTQDELDYWGTNPRKVAADKYIDDRIVGGFPGWQTIMPEIEQYLLSEQPED